MRYGLIPYIKQITFSPCKVRVHNNFLTSFTSVYIKRRIHINSSNLKSRKEFEYYKLVHQEPKASRCYDVKHIFPSLYDY